MRIAIGIDWSDQAFTAVTQTFQLYHPTDVTLVHGVNLGFFEQPIIAEATNLQGYNEFRNAMVDAGRRRSHVVSDELAAPVRHRTRSRGLVHAVHPSVGKTLDADDQQGHRAVSHHVPSECGHRATEDDQTGSHAGGRAADVHDRADEISRWILAEKTPLALPDGRWDKMSYGVRDCEEFLRAIS